MHTQISNRTDVIFQYLRGMLGTLYSTYKKVVPMVGFIRDNKLFSITTVTSGKTEDAILAGVIGSAGYKADGIVMLNEGLSASTDINPLTGREWQGNEIEDVLLLDGGLGVVKRNITLVCAQRNMPFEVMFQEFDLTRRGFRWGDVFTETEASGIDIVGQVPDTVREILSCSDSNSLSDSELAHQFQDATSTCLNRDQNTTSILLSKGLPTMWAVDFPHIVFSDDC